jgi:DNA-binding transcriptional LysR family regulator
LTDGDALLCACIEGCGLAQLPGWLAEEALNASTLVPVLSELAGSAMPIHVVWQKTWHFQPKVRVAVDELVSLAEMRPEIFKAG